MKTQWSLIVGLVFAIIVAVFASINVSEVRVNFLFGYSYWPLVLIILGSALAGVFISACFAAVKIFKYRREVGQLQKELKEVAKLLVSKDQQLVEKEAQIMRLQPVITENTSENVLDDALNEEEPVN